MVWPTSGWFSKIIHGIANTKKLRKYAVLEVPKLSFDKIFAIVTIKKGFTNSIGWKRKNNKFNQRLDPFTSTPINKTKNKEINTTIKTGTKIFSKKLNWIEEIIIIKSIADIAKTKCFEKKK